MVVEAESHWLMGVEFNYSFSQVECRKIRSPENPPGAGIQWMGFDQIELYVTVR